MKATRKNRALTPIALAWAMILPFIWVVGGAALMLALAAITVGIDPAPFVAEFLADATVVLTPLALKLGGIWVAYTAIYFALTWAYRPSFDPFKDIDQPQGKLSDHLGVGSLQHVIVALGYCLTLLKRRPFWTGVGLSWAPGAHPQIE